MSLFSYHLGVPLWVKAALAWGYSRPGGYNGPKDLLLKKHLHGRRPHGLRPIVSSRVTVNSRFHYLGSAYMGKGFMGRGYSEPKASLLKKHLHSRRPCGPRAIMGPRFHYLRNVYMDEGLIGRELQWAIVNSLFSVYSLRHFI